MSVWDSESDDEREKVIFADARKGSNQKKHYSKNKHCLSGKKSFHTSHGLSTAVQKVGHGDSQKQQYKANTHLLVSKPGTNKRFMVNLSTLTAMNAFALRYKTVTLPPATNVFGKGSHIHAEMYLIACLTGGDERLVAGCMRDMHLVVDKPVCKQCYPYVLLAGPSLVDDGTDFFKENENSGKRTDYSGSWKSPFLKKFGFAKPALKKHPFE